MLEGEGAVGIYSGDVRKFAVLKRKTFPLPREGKKTWWNRTKTVLKRDANFSLEIHIFFSSQKNVNRLRKIRMFQGSFYSIDY